MDLFMDNQLVPHGNAGINPIEKLHVLFLGVNISGFILPMAHLQEYLDSLGRFEVGIIVHTVVNDYETRASRNIKIIELDITNKDAILKYAVDNNVDIIFDQTKLFTKRDIFKNSRSFHISSDPIDQVIQMESYLAGHSVIWNIAKPIWHSNWIYKYTQHVGISPVAFEFISVGQRNNYTTKQMEFVRALANKAMHVEYARGQLYFYLQLKRRAFRAGNEYNDFNFELTYHLTNYTMYICSIMDILARLLKDKYNLGCPRFKNYSISKTEFIDKLFVKRKSLSNIFKGKRFQDWAEWMLARRNNITHESNLYLTPLKQEKEDKLTDEELEALVDTQLDWNELEPMDTTGFRSMVKQNLELRHNYEEVVSDMMMLVREDQATKKEQHLIVFPLRTIDSDFKNIEKVLLRVVKNISISISKS